MTDIRGYHHVGDLRRMFPPDVAGKVIRAFIAHGQVVQVDIATGTVVADGGRASENSYITPDVWMSMVNIAQELQDRLATIEHVRAVRSRLSTKVNNEKKAIKRIKEWMEWADREEIELRKQRDAAGEGELDYLRREALKDLAEYENNREIHIGMIGTCDDVLQKL